MKIIVQKEFDGNYYVGSCENLPNCYAQCDSAEGLLKMLRQAIEVYRKSYANRKQNLPNSFEAPILDKQISCNKISSEQFAKFLSKNKYKEEYKDKESHLFINSLFPFNRVHLPVTEDLSPLIVAKIIGKENFIYKNHKQMKMNSA